MGSLFTIVINPTLPKDAPGGKRQFLAKKYYPQKMQSRDSCRYFYIYRSFDYIEFF